MVYMKTKFLGGFIGSNITCQIRHWQFLFFGLAIGCKHGYNSIVSRVIGVAMNASVKAMPPRGLEPLFEP